MRAAAVAERPSLISCRKERFCGYFAEFSVDVIEKSAIIMMAFFDITPAFLFLLPSLRKKAGVF